MAAAATKGRKLLSLAAALLAAAAALLLPASADASRYLPTSLPAIASPQPSLEEPAAGDVDEGPRFAFLTAGTRTDLAALAAGARLEEQRFRLPATALELARGQKTASGGVTTRAAANDWRHNDLAAELRWDNQSGQNLLFQGLWTDPVTGISYARARWYDARNASWLSEDPAQDVDSPNFYAFVGWGPHATTDPLGLAILAPPGMQKRLLEKHRQQQGHLEGAQESLDEITSLLSSPWAPAVDRFYLLELAAAGVETVAHLAGAFLSDPGLEVMSAVPVNIVAAPLAPAVGLVDDATRLAPAADDLARLGPASDVAPELAASTIPETKALPAGSEVRALPSGGQATRTRAQVARFRGTRQARGRAFEEHLEETQGGKPQARVETKRGTRIHDLGNVPTGTVTEMAIEGKNYLRVRTFQGQVVKGEVPLSGRIQEEIHKDVLWIREGRKLGIHRIVQWEFAGAGPSKDLARTLENFGLPFVH